MATHTHVSLLRVGSDRRTICAVILSLTLSLIATVCLPEPLEAQTFEVLHAFFGKDGAHPQGPLLLDSTGNLYGSTIYGGRHICGGCGVIFEFSASGEETTLHKFTGSDGAHALGGLFKDHKGNLYGVTSDGGANRGGTVFKLTGAGKLIVLHTFTGVPDGQFPQSGVVRTADGRTFGATVAGGTGVCDIEFNISCGTIFEIAGGRYEGVFLNFMPDTGPPNGDLISDELGNLYGTTTGGGDLSCGAGHGCGTIFRVDPNGIQTVLHAFTAANGKYPSGGLVRDENGNLYGTTDAGGAHHCGTVFRLGASGELTVLYNFTDAADGRHPSGPLALDSAGNLYGTTTWGGAGHQGTVFRLDPSGHKSVLHAFETWPEGFNPIGGVVLDSRGNLYGTTSVAGVSENCCGTLFRIKLPPQP